MTATYLPPPSAADRRDLPAPVKRRWPLVAVLLLAVVVLGIIDAIQGPSGADRAAKADSDACYAQLTATVNSEASRGIQLTQDEQQTTYDYCMDLRQGRVPTERPQLP